ncbi:MAG TPA: hypothetical protein VF189_05000 [Patescibacteria group bacterium]
MKIGFLASKRGEKQFRSEFLAIIDYLSKKGHSLIHHMEIPVEDILPLSYAKRQELFMEFYKELEECDLIIVETSLQSTQVGFGLAYLRMKGKPVVVLSQGEATFPFFPKGEVYSNLDNMMAYSYKKENFKKILDEALSYMKPHLEKRFTIIFPSHLLAKVEEHSKKRKLPKSVYIRQLIEEDLKKSA